MARLPRLVIPHQPHHLIQRGNNGQEVFRDAEDFTVFLGFLRDAAKAYRVAVHAYVLLPDHMRLLASPADDTGLGRMMQWVGRHYVPYFNRKYGRTGTLWEGRYKAAVIEAEPYFMACSRFMESAAVRTGLTGEPESYPWSSYPHHAGMRMDALITDHPLYWSLGNTPFEREQAYRQLMQEDFSAKDWIAMEAALNKGWPLGSESFKKELEKKTGQRASFAKRGRPARKASSQPSSRS